MTYAICDGWTAMPSAVWLFPCLEWAAAAQLGLTAAAQSRNAAAGQGRLSDWFLSAATTRQINHKGRTPEVNPLFSPVLNSREKEDGRALASERKMTRTLSAFKIKMQMSWSIPFWVTQPIYCKLTVAQSWILHFLQLVQSSLILVLNIAGASLSTSGWFVCLCY